MRKVFPENTENLNSKVAKVVTYADSHLWLCGRVKQVVLAMKGSWRAAVAWYCERAGEVIVEGAASVAVEGQD